jgi:universal stress protein A
MPLFKKILAPTDFSDNAAAAIRLAAKVAEECHGELYVIHVVDSSRLRYAVREGMLTGEDTDDSVSHKTQVEADRRLAEELVRIGDGIVPSVSSALFGEPWRTIVDYVETHGIDLIVVGRRGVTLADVMLGSVAERVIRHAPCPVLVTKRTGA